MSFSSHITFDTTEKLVFITTMSVPKMVDTFIWLSLFQGWLQIAQVWYIVQDILEVHVFRINSLYLITFNVACTSANYMPSILASQEEK